MQSARPLQASELSADKVQTRIYIASSVETDYVRFLANVLPHGFSIILVSAIREFKYRELSRSRGARKAFLRIAMYIGYPVYLLFKSLFAPRGSIFIVTSNTFYAPFLVCCIGLLKDFRTIHLVYDLFPDALEVSGALSINGMAARSIGTISRWANYLSDASVYLGEFLRRHGDARWGSNSSQSFGIHIGVDSSRFPKSVSCWSRRRLGIHYGGQLGFMHDAEALIQAVALVARSAEEPWTQIDFSLLVSGAFAQLAHAELSSTRVSVGKAIPSDEWRERVKSFQIGLVGLSPGGATVCLPSKTYSMMAAGLAIVAICPVWSDLGRMILRHDAGWVINNSPYSSIEELQGADYLIRVRKRIDIKATVDEFISLTRVLATDYSQVEFKRGNARRAVENHYSRSPLKREWKKLFDLLCPPERAGIEAPEPLAN